MQPLSIKNDSNTLWAYTFSDRATAETSLLKDALFSQELANTRIDFEHLVRGKPAMLASRNRDQLIHNAGLRERLMQSYRVIVRNKLIFIPVHGEKSAEGFF